MALVAVLNTSSNHCPFKKTHLLQVGFFVNIDSS